MSRVSPPWGKSSKIRVAGIAPGDVTHSLSATLSELIELESLMDTETTLTQCSTLPQTHHCTYMSSTMTKPSGMTLEDTMIGLSPTSQNLKAIGSPTSFCRQEFVVDPWAYLVPVQVNALDGIRLHEDLPLPVDDIIKEDVFSRRKDVGVLTFAQRVDPRNTSVPTALEDRLAPVGRAIDYLPKYKRGYAWPLRARGECKSASQTEWVEPFPRPPPKEFCNLDALETIKMNPHLFQIVTPIKVDILRDMLITHPNQPFVESICVGLEEGFWPYADTRFDDGFPITWDGSRCLPKTDLERSFIHEQRDIEIQMGCFSPSFGPALLPGMYSTPVHSVPKPHSEKFRLIVNHSGSKFPLNAMVDPLLIKGAPLDSLHELGQALLQYRSCYGRKRRLVVVKCDISRAYRMCPMHRLWQIKQVVTTNFPTREEEARGVSTTLVRNVDRNNNFGGKASCRIFVFTNALIMWIAIHIIGIQDIFSYIDDEFTFDDASKLERYEPYAKLMPVKQCQLLRLWDRLGVPHEESKQVWGEKLTVIGFDVDPNAMTFSLSPPAKAELTERIAVFSQKRRHTLREMLSLIGWINWSFNVFPLLKPGLSALYQKISGKTNLFATVTVNKAIRDDLKWLLTHLEKLSGILLLEAQDWKPEQADCAVWCDASLTGLGFWIPTLNAGFHALLGEEWATKTIFFYEALCVYSALHHVLQSATYRPMKRVTIYTDSHNTVDIFFTLKAKPGYNDILKGAISLLITSETDLRVIHVPGAKNVVADALSRGRLDHVRQLLPSITLSEFQPPRDALGAAKK